MDAYRFSISWSRIYPSKFTSKYVNFIYMYVCVYILVNHGYSFPWAMS
jgi:beta-glucosidase/6-phospho-beta-glucosidase/beta-galactosidase